MQYTDHYNLNLPEGTDIVNPLVQDNPNYTAIDGALYANKLRTVGNATEVKTGTVHAITRSDSDIDVIRFTATGNWDAGDSMTVDGTPVTVYLPNGASPLTGAYIINTEVICAVKGSRVTLYTGGASSIGASDVTYDNTLSGLSSNNAQGAIDELSECQNIKYDNTVSGLTATDVQGAIDEIASGSSGEYVEVIADGAKTAAQLLNDLYNLIDSTKINAKSVLQYSGYFMHRVYDYLGYAFGMSQCGSTNLAVHTVTVGTSSRYDYVNCNIGATPTYTNNATNIPSVGTKIRIYY